MSIVCARAADERQLVGRTPIELFDFGVSFDKVPERDNRVRT
jgi:hypothetical protein